MHPLDAVNKALTKTEIMKAKISSELRVAREELSRVIKYVDSVTDKGGGIVSEKTLRRCLNKIEVAYDKYRDAGGEESRVAEFYIRDLIAMIEHPEEYWGQDVDRITREGR